MHLHPEVPWLPFFVWCMARVIRRQLPEPRDALHQWQPWAKSTGPRPPAWKSASSKNAIKHGMRGWEYGGNISYWSS